MARGVRATRGFLTEFKEFALKGNVVDLAIGVIIGGAFGRVIEALVTLITESFLPADLSFDDIRIGGLAIGPLITASINFLIIAFVLFLFITAFNRLRRKEEVEEPPDPVLEANKELAIAMTRLTDTIERRPLP
ncbi:MAG: large conductance mechanosensitive channel protein MscL [Kaiparowitsia implicata GSE-PSE-MK54-09C]|jgi:large conductance mechanosensitive channel|nr:large conductance mechanosensitive channel protein MscL [Kaiparowitsia implicata GSE-PSE-MK54-09C]